MKEEEWKERTVYDDGVRTDMVSDDAMEPQEEGFVQGYEETIANDYDEGIAPVQDPLKGLGKAGPEERIRRYENYEER